MFLPNRKVNLRKSKKVMLLFTLNTQDDSVRIRHVMSETEEKY